MDDDLARYPGLYQRDTTWYVRKRVPVDVRSWEPREQIRLSLETSDRKAATRLYPAKLAEIEARFEVLRNEGASRETIATALRRGEFETLTVAQIDQLIRAWWAQRAPIPIADALTDPERRQSLMMSLEDDLANLERPPSDEEDIVDFAARQILLSAGAPALKRRLGLNANARVPSILIDRWSGPYRYLCERVTQLLKHEAETAKEELLGRRQAGPRLASTASFDGALAFARTPDAQRTLKELIASFRSEREARFGQESTDRKYAMLFRVMGEVWGEETPVTSLGRESLIHLSKFLEKLPPNALKKFPNYTLREASAFAEQYNLPRLAPNTVGSYLQNAVAVLNWAADQGWTPAPRSKGIIPPRRDQVKRRGFRPEELHQIFEQIAQMRDQPPEKFWIPALAMYTGARAGEICQLRAEDIVSVDGQTCINLSLFDDRGYRIPGRRLKTVASERIVPLHNEIISAGFETYISEFRAQDSLFPSFLVTSEDAASKRLSRWFSHFKRKTGFSERSLCFHSFRHGFRDACRLANIAEETVFALGGWATVNQASKYGDRSQVRVLARALQTVTYGDFHLPQPLPSNAVRPGGATVAP